MIEINLLTGSAQRSARTQLPRLPRLPLKGSMPAGGGGRAAAAFERAGRPRWPADRWLLFAVLAWLIAALFGASTFVSTSDRLAELEVAIEGARLDSTRYAEMRAANELLLARQDTIAQKLEVIQEIDASRYTWAHIIDEISRTVPQFTWLVGITHLPGDAPLDAPRFVIDGRAGNTFALTRLMQDLEASPFIRNITLLETDQLREHEKSLYAFQLEAQFEHAPPDVIQTVSIFARR